jgi:GT2 family glycosyltransferase
VSSSLSNNPTLKFSIIIVTHNSDDEILPCLQALGQSSNAHQCEIIVIDNASADSTKKSLSAFQHSTQSFAEFHAIYNQNNRGFTAALNQGIAIATAPFVLLLNPDTLIYPETLTKLELFLHDDSSIGIVAPQLKNSDGSVQPSCRRFPRHRDVVFTVFGLAAIFRKNSFFNGWRMGDFDHQYERFVDQPQGACLLTRSETVKKVGGWDEQFPMFFSDVDWCRRVIRAGYKILFTPEVHIIHHQGKSVLPNRAAMVLSSHRSFIRYFLKYYRGWKWWIPNFIVALILVMSGFMRYLITEMAKVMRRLW